jgi:hypothetical protein
MASRAMVIFFVTKETPEVLSKRPESVSCRLGASSVVDYLATAIETIRAYVMTQMGLTGSGIDGQGLGLEGVV